MVGIFQFFIKFNINKVVIVKFATVLLCTKKENVLLPGPIGPRTLSHSRTEIMVPDHFPGNFLELRIIYIINNIPIKSYFSTAK